MSAKVIQLHCIYVITATSFASYKMHIFVENNQKFPARKHGDVGRERDIPFRHPSTRRMPSAFLLPSPRLRNPNNAAGCGSRWVDRDLRGVSDRVVQWDRLTSSASGKHACGEGQRLQSRSSSSSSSSSRTYKITWYKQNIASRTRYTNYREKN